MQRQFKSKILQQFKTELLFISIIFIFIAIILNVFFTALYCRNIILLLLNFGIVIPVLLFFMFFLIWKHYYLPARYTNQILRIISLGDLDAYKHFAANNQVSSDYDIKQVLELFQNMAADEYKKNSLHDHTTIQMLQSQINPHFLYNALENIRSIALKENVKQIADMTEALALFFRYNISYKGEVITLEEELTNVDHYFFIQQFRFNNCFHFEVILDGCDKDVYQQIIPRLTLQPVIENAIYHGLEPKLGEKRITIRITETAQRLMILISDNGVGIPENLLGQIQNSISTSGSSSGQYLNPSSGTTQNNGIALSNINQRIQLLFGKEYGLTMNSTVCIGTDVEITLPLIKNMDMVDYEKRNFKN